MCHTGTGKVGGCLSRAIRGYVGGPGLSFLLSHLMFSQEWSHLTPPSLLLMNALRLQTEESICVALGRRPGLSGPQILSCKNEGVGPWLPLRTLWICSQPPSPSHDFPESSTSVHWKLKKELQGQGSCMLASIQPLLGRSREAVLRPGLHPSPGPKLRSLMAPLAPKSFPWRRFHWAPLS